MSFFGGGVTEKEGGRGTGGRRGKEGDFPVTRD